MTSWTWSNNTIAGIGLAALESGDMVAYTASNGETIAYSVPEPTSLLLSMFGTATMLTSRRRRSRV